MATPSTVHGRISARKFAQHGPVKLTPDDVADYAALKGIGINIDNHWVQQTMQGLGVAMDAAYGNNTGPMPAGLSGITTPGIAAQVQFLQAWLPGFVQVVSAARKIDTLVGRQTVGTWEDEEVVQGVMEPLGLAQPYMDHSNIPLASWNLNWERRSIIRFELGFEVGLLEEARAARVRVATAAEKRKGVALALDIQRNRVGFYGYNNGENRTYGFLNDPALPAYVTVAQGASGSTQWSEKTFLEITKDLRLALMALRTNSKGVIDPKDMPLTLALPTSCVDLLTTTSDFGISVLDWLKENYPNVRVESAPELDEANAGENVMFLYAERVDDGSSDDASVWTQIVPAQFMTLGVEKRSKTYCEDFANALAGCMLKRPFAVYAATGI